MQRKYSEDQLALEREVMLLRSAKTENLSDQNRNQYILSSLEQTKKRLLDRIEALEDFIIEQDEVGFKEFVQIIILQLLFIDRYSPEKNYGGKMKLQGSAIFLKSQYLKEPLIILA